MYFQYTSDDVLAKPQWADPPLDSPKVRVPAYNTLDGPVDRRSHHGNYKLNEGVPRNPRGRTGMIGNESRLILLWFFVMHSPTTSSTSS